MRIAVCDDDIREQEQFEKALKEWDPTGSAEKFYNGAALLTAARTSPAFDVVFLDICMPGENGIAIAEELHKISPDTAVVFVTFSRDYAVDAFSVYAIHYIIKPVTAEDIDEVFRRLAKNRTKHGRRITLISGKDRYTVCMEQIYLLESNNHTVNVSLADGRRIRVNMSFCELEKNLSEDFLRLNRGISVNMDCISQLTADVCILQNGIELPVSVRRRAAIRRTYDNYVFAKLSQKKREFKEGET